MKIQANEKNNLFKLETKNMQYIIFVDHQNYLRHIYLGKPIHDFSLETMSDNFCNDFSKTYLALNREEKIYQDNYSSTYSLMEIGSNGKNDKRGSLISIKQEDGSYFTDFIYLSHRIYKGLPELSKLPCCLQNNKNCESLEFVLKEKLSNLKMILTYSIIEELDAVIRTTILVNDTLKTIDIIRCNSIQLDLSSAKYDHIHLCGDWANERNIIREQLKDGKKVICSDYGKSSHEENPLNIVLSPDCDEIHGEAFGFNILYSGNFKFECNVDKYLSTRILLGISDNNFDFNLMPEEKLELPQGIIVYSKEGLNKLSQTFADLIRDHIIRYKRAKEYRPLIFNSWEGCFFNFNTESILTYMEEAKKIGTELFVLDDGWFGERNNDFCSLGDWFINQKKIDLKRVIDRCHELKMKFGIWFEPEMVNVNSKFYREHPHCSLGHDECELELSRHQLFLDLTDEKIIEDLSKQICKILDEYDIDYVKWDHNRSLADSYSYHLGKARQGEVSYQLTLGFYDLCHRIIDTHQDIMFEGCASGGGRFDLGIAYYFPQIWCSDETDPIQRLYIEYGTSLGYPLSMMGSHVARNPITSYLTKSQIALFGTYGYEFNPTVLNDLEKEELKSGLDIYHKYHKDVIQNGDFYRLSSPFDSNYASMMSVSKNKDKALFLFVNFRKEGNSYRFIKLLGLDSNKKYYNSLDNKVYYGDYYMNIGLNITKRINEFSSFLVILEEK